MLIFCLCVLLFACGKDNEGTNPQASVEMKATVSMNNFSFDATQVVAIEFQEYPTLWFVTGTDADQNSLQLTIPKNATLGEHAFSNADEYAGQFFKNGDETYTDTNEGNITITEKTANTIKGTFSFTALSPFQILMEETITVSNGSFRVNLED